MVIPADLPALVAPVAWMLGTWEGWGMYAAPAVPVEGALRDIRTLTGVTIAAEAVTR